MTASHALFPGSFDPPTSGHLDLIERALTMFGRVTVGIAVHPTKQSLFSVAERTELLMACIGEREGVDVQSFDGLVVDAAASFGCTVLVRGVRSVTDYDYESQMAGANRHLSPGLDTCLLATRPELAHVTSTLVRQIAGMGGNLDSFVAPPVARALRTRFEREV